MREHSKAWIDLYGEEAYEAAVVATNWVLELDFPPPPAPEFDANGFIMRSSGGHRELPQGSDTEIMQAAWGGPRLWKPQFIDPCSLTQMLGLYNQIQVRQALPDQLIPLRPEQ